MRDEGGDISHDAEGRVRWGKKAAGILIRRMDTGDFLLLLRSPDVMDPGVLGIPGGRVESGEAEEEAALAEAEEELGPIPPLTIVGRDVYTSGDFSYITFLATIEGEDAEAWKPTLNWENDAWVWASAEEALALNEVHPNVRKVIEAWV